MGVFLLWLQLYLSDAQHLYHGTLLFFSSTGQLQLIVFIHLGQTTLKRMGNTTSSSDIHNLLIVCLTLALLMSIIFNIYAFCMKTHRDVGQRCYNFSTCRDTRQTTQQDGETEEQIKVGEDVQYAAVNFSREKTKRKTTETENKEILYSSVANFGLE